MDWTDLFISPSNVVLLSPVINSDAAREVLVIEADDLS